MAIAGLSDTLEWPCVCWSPRLRTQIKMWVQSRWKEGRGKWKSTGERTFFQLSQVLLTEKEKLLPTLKYWAGEVEKVGIFKLLRVICPVLPMPCFSQTWTILQHTWALGLALIPLRFRKHLVSGPQSPINKTPQHPPDLHGDIPQMEKVQDRHFLCSSL